MLQASGWLSGLLLSGVVLVFSSPCYLISSMLMPVCLAQGVQVSVLSLLLHGKNVLSVPACQGGLKLLWLLREARWPRIWSNIVLEVVAIDKGEGSGQER